MRILVLGGGGFVGRHAVETLLTRGHEVSVFTRGRAPVVPGATSLVGDRDTGDLAALVGSGAPGWDAVIDVTGYVAGQVEAAIAALGGPEGVGRYLFVSSHAVYVEAELGPGADETVARRAPIRAPSGPLTDATYGPAKVACEDAVSAAFGGSDNLDGAGVADRTTIVRLGKVAGPHDNQPGLGDWVDLVLAAAEAGRGADAGGGSVEVPGDGSAPIQLIDARDAAVLMARLLEDDRGGAYNAVGSSHPIRELVTVCARACGVDVRPVPGDPARRYPLLTVGRSRSSRQRANAKAVAAGMPLRSLAATVTDVVAERRLAARATAADAARGDP